MDLFAALPQIINVDYDTPTKEDSSSELLDKELIARRGRGRPPKNGICAAYREKRPPRGRGRPRKRGKVKIIVATGKGRGRPKMRTRSDDSSDDELSSNNATSKQYKSLLKSVKKQTKPRGRPRKPRPSDQDTDDDYDRMPVGRPATGAINLNIERTGRGQGRPRKNFINDSSTFSSKQDKENDIVSIATVAKKRGRPSLGKAPRIPTGRPRGRPKSGSTHGMTPTEYQSNDEQEMEEEEQSETPSIKIVKWAAYKD